MIKAGRFEIKFWAEGDTIACELLAGDSVMLRFSHTELSDLAYVIKKASIEAREALKPFGRQHEVME